MATRNYYVEFKLSVSDVRLIRAENADDAARIADQMRFDYDYWNGVCEGMENDYDQWRSKYAEIDVLGEAPEDMEADNEEEQV